MTTTEAGEAAAAIAAPARKKVARKTWTTARKTRFLDTLASTCNVAESARKVKMSDSAVYALRARSQAFADAWAAALRIGYERLELTLLERALRAQEGEPPGPAEAKAIEAANRLGLHLLAAHKGSVEATAGRKPASIRAGSAREWLETKLAEMNKRMGGDG